MKKTLLALVLAAQAAASGAQELQVRVVPKPLEVVLAEASESLGIAFKTQVGPEFLPDAGAGSRPEDGTEVWQAALWREYAAILLVRAHSRRSRNEAKAGIDKAEPGADFLAIDLARTRMLVLRSGLESLRRAVVLSGEAAASAPKWKVYARESVVKEMTDLLDKEIVEARAVESHARVSDLRIRIARIEQETRDQAAGEERR